MSRGAEIAETGEEVASKAKRRKDSLRGEKNVVSQTSARRKSKRKKPVEKVTMEDQIENKRFRERLGDPEDRRVSNETSFSHARPSREKSSRGCCYAS